MPPKRRRSQVVASHEEIPTEASSSIPALPEQKPANDCGLAAWERRYWADGFSVVAGTDEAGRGPLAGPVVAAAFAILSQEDEEVLALLDKVADSKQMTAQLRDEAFELLTDPNLKGRVAWAIAEASVTEIDELNILQASLLAMARAVRALDSDHRPDVVLVDGCNRPPDLLAPGEQWTRGSRQNPVEDERVQPKLSKWFTKRPSKELPVETVMEVPAACDDHAATWRPRRVEAVIEGDGRVPSISAASVLAKVHRDRAMEELHKRYPLYGFGTHKGYGTEAHIEAIQANGVCPEHRRSFAPVRAALGLPPLESGNRGPIVGQQQLTFGSATSVPATQPPASSAKKVESPSGPTASTRAVATASRGRGKIAALVPAHESQATADIKETSSLKEDAKGETPPKRRKLTENKSKRKAKNND